VSPATEERLRSRLREQPLPGEGEAAARSWPVVEAAFAERGPTARPRRVLLRLALVTALLGVGLVAALTPAGAEVGHWIEDRFANSGDPAGPAFAGLPAGGSVLTISSTGAYAIDDDGGAQRLGSFTDAGWSPRGVHVVGVNGRRLTAVDATGTVKWTLARQRRVHHPSWSTGLGYAVAYLEGPTLHVVAGTGDPSTDRALRRGAAAVSPAWRPRSDQVLTYATAGGVIETLDVVSGRALWRARSGASAAGPGDSGRLVALAWSRNGRTLVALSSRSVTVLDVSGQVLRTIALPAVGRELALHPSGRRAAVVVGGGALGAGGGAVGSGGGGGTRVLDVPLRGAGRPRQLFQGGVDGLAWSRDGRRLLLAWRDADEWLLLGPGGRVRRALHGVSDELGAAGGFPRVAGWCCSR
jgi:hypothetical protein